MYKKLFKDFSERNDRLPFSLKYSWWNEVVRENWDVAVIENQGQVKAFWPYAIRKKFGFTILGQSTLTPYCGPYIVYPEGQKNSAKYSYEKRMIKKLIQQLPAYDYFEQNCHLLIQNTLPFIWEGFEQTTRYTHILNDISNKEKLYSGIANNIKREIKKAKESLKVIESENVEALKKCMRSSFQIQGKEVPIEDKIFNRYNEYIHKHNCGKILLAYNKEEKVVAGIGIIWDHHSAYYILGGADHRHKNSGAMSLLLWKAIQTSSKKVRKFNFEGSMVPSIEKFFRAFGGELTPYSQISHQNSKLFDFLKRLKK